MSTTPPRNAPCPCGSGTKYKYCCLGKPTPSKRGKPLLWIAAGLMVAGALVAAGIRNRPKAPEPSSSVGAVPSARATPGSKPQPWEYDAARDRHWHSEHGHWHQGPPPPDQVPVNRGAPLRDGTAWEYDAETDSHWHPGHGHWHRGPPPNLE